MKLGFKWGRLKGKSMDNVDFYESFALDGVDYFLYDCVYMQPADDDSEVPYIGKIVKIMNHPKDGKIVKIVWFFRPAEIWNWLRARDITYRAHEIFLGSGEGSGVANFNPVEAIVGKCHVVCTSKDKRNPQPSQQELTVAEFVFYRTFDVHECTFSDQLDKNISGIEVEHFLNNKDYPKLSRYQELKEAENPKSSGSDKDNLKALILQAKEKTQLKPVEGVVYHSSSFQRSSFVEDVSLGDSRKLHRLSAPPLQGGEVMGNAAGAQKPRMRSKNAATLYIRHDQPVDFGRINAHPELVDGKGMQLDCMKTKVRAKKSFEPANQTILSSASLDKTTKVLDKQVAPRPARKMKNSLNTQYIDIKEPGKDFVPHDEGILSPVIPSKRPTEFPDSKLAPEFTQEKSGAEIQHLNMKKPKLIERREEVCAKDLGGHRRGIPSTVNLNNKATRLLNEEAPEASPLKKMFSSDSLTLETQQKEDVTWEQKMDHACEKGTLVRLQNLDPSYTSAEIVDIIQTYLSVKCTAKVLQQSTFSSPHNGQALLIFEKEAQAKMVISELHNRCLMLPNGRPLIARRGVSRVLPDKSAKLIGHLMPDRTNKHREQPKEVSTSHCAQPNTVEYELALDWIVLQKRSEVYWRTLYEGHRKELAALKVELNRGKVSN